MSKYTANPTVAADAAARTAAVEKYVPLLESLVRKKDNVALVNQSRNLRYRWNSPLEGRGNAFSLEDIEHERGMAWMLRAACKRQEAVCAVAERPRAQPTPTRHEEDDERVVPIGGSVLSTPTATPSVSVNAPKTTPLTGGGTPKSPGPVLGEAAPVVATILREAAGVYKHAALDVLPPLKHSLGGLRPNELLASMADAMRCVCLAEAQAATVRRAEEKGTGHALLCKLHIGAGDLFKRADVALNEHVSDFNFFSRKLQAYIYLGQAMHRARAYRALAEEAWEATEVGEAIALMNEADKQLQRGRDAASETDWWRHAALEESEAAVALRGKYVRENELVFFEKVPAKSSKRLPEGKVIVSEIDPPISESMQNLFVE